MIHLNNFLSAIFVLGGSLVAVLIVWALIRMIFLNLKEDLTDLNDHINKKKVTGKSDV